MSHRILIADDDLEDLELLEEAFLELEPSLLIDKARGGLAAIENLRSYPDSCLPNLIVVDYNMPDLDGIGVLTYLKDQDRYRTIPKIIYSTSDADKYIKQSMQNGATKYFVKPKTKKELDEIASTIVALIN